MVAKASALRYWTQFGNVLEDVGLDLAILHGVLVLHDIWKKKPNLTLKLNVF